MNILQVISTFKFHSELAESLNLPTDEEWHTGIVRHEKNSEYWKRESDGRWVQLQGWKYSYPRPQSHRDFVYLELYEDSHKGEIYNYDDSEAYYFICEFAKKRLKLKYLITIIYTVY